MSDSGAAVLIRSGWLVDGRGGKPQPNAVVEVAADKIVSIGAWDPSMRADFDFPTGTLMPGLIDVHAHFTFDLGARTYEQFMSEETDDQLVERGVENCRLHAMSGVTSARDAGARGDTALRLRDLAKADQMIAPRLQVSGPPITTKHGHFWFCGGDVEGATGVRDLARHLVGRGVDFIKIMASGGGTTGTDSSRASFSAAEISVAVEEAHRAGLSVMAHCLSADSVVASLDAGVDEIEHINFIRPDGSRVMSEDVADRIAACGVFVSPTIQTGFRQLEVLEAISTPTAAQLKERDSLRYKLDTKIGFVRTLHQRGARIVAGTDALGSFGDFAIGLELLVQAGLTPLDAISAATSVAAAAIGRSNVGTIEVGKQADLVVVEGDASSDITRCRYVSVVMRGGELFPAKAPA